ncbi:MAG: hypothetical protein ACI9LV_000773 [Candidatus Nanohaloarchaea archaeon]|jgi:hypothetical protein
MKMNLVSKILGSSEEKYDFGPDTVDSVVGHDDNFDDVADQYFAPNVGEIRGYLEDLPKNARATLNGEPMAEGRDEILDLYDSWVDGIDPQNEYLIQETETKEGQAEMSIEVGDIEEVTYEVQGNRIGESSIKVRDRLPGRGIGRAEIEDVELGEPSYEIEIEWERVT